MPIFGHKHLSFQLKFHRSANTYFPKVQIIQKKTCVCNHVRKRPLQNRISFSEFPRPILVTPKIGFLESNERGTKKKREQEKNLTALFAEIETER